MGYDNLTIFLFFSRFLLFPTFLQKAITQNFINEKLIQTSELYFENKHTFMFLYKYTNNNQHMVYNCIY